MSHGECRCMIEHKHNELACLFASCHLYTIKARSSHFDMTFGLSTECGLITASRVDMFLYK